MSGEHHVATERISHTPGPWSVRETRSTVSVKSASGETIGSWYAGFTSGTVTHANARLIAAAPDLLTALKAMDESLCNGFDTQAARHAGRMALIAARAAIAKAEGRS